MIRLYMQVLTTVSLMNIKDYLQIYIYLMSILLTWFNSNPGMDKSLRQP